MNRAAAIGSITLTLASVLALTACGGSGGAGVAAGAKQTLTVWAMGTEGEKLGDVAKVYEKAHPNVTIKVTPVGWDVAHQKLVAAAAAGKLPDVVQMGGSYLGEFADMGALEPVDTTTFKQGDYFPAAWQQGQYDGKTYGVPWYVDTRVLYYRTDLAKTAGIAQAPATMADLQKDAAAYQSKAHTKYGLYIQSAGLDTVQSFYPFLYSAGGAILDDTGKPVVNSPEAVKALDYYSSYIKKGLTQKSVRRATTSPRTSTPAQRRCSSAAPGCPALSPKTTATSRGNGPSPRSRPTPRARCRWPAAPASRSPRTASTRPPRRTSSST